MAFVCRKEIRFSLFSPSAVVVLSMLTVMLLVTISCERDKYDGYNQFVVKGNDKEYWNISYDVGEASILDPVLSNCDTAVFGSMLRISFTNYGALFLFLNDYDEMLQIPEGTLSVAGECEEGFNAVFVMEDIKKGNELYLDSGTLIVENDMGTYTITLDALFTSLAGGGSIKGSYRGIPSKDN